jgi:hypothetical protein
MPPQLQAATARPLPRNGGHFPGPDHGGTPQASLDNYRLFYGRRRKMCVLRDRAAT